MRINKKKSPKILPRIMKFSLPLLIILFLVSSTTKKTNFKPLNNPNETVEELINGNMRFIKKRND